MYKYSFSNTLDLGSIPDKDRLFDGIKSCRMPLIDTISQQAFFETNLGKLEKGCCKPEQQKEAIANLYKFYDTLEELIWLFDYLTIILQSSLKLNTEQ